MLLAASACLSLAAAAALAPRRARAMSWFAHAASNEGLVDNLLRFDILRSEDTAAAMASVDRRLFVRQPEAAYLDTPSPIG